MRVVAGLWGGRKLASPEGTGVRPTTDRVKEAMFAALHFDLPGASVLDMFGGSGALGIEAASRGASKVVIIEESSRARRTITENLRRVGNPACIEVVAGSCETAVRKLEGKSCFDIALLDPPYHAGIYESALRLLVDAGLMVSGARAAIESDHKLELDVGGFTAEKTKRYGQIYLLYGRFSGV